MNIRIYTTLFFMVLCTTYGYCQNTDSTIQKTVKPIPPTSFNIKLKTGGSDNEHQKRKAVYKPRKEKVEMKRNSISVK